MINDEAGKVLKEVFDSFKNRYQNNLESMKRYEFVFDYLQLLYYHGDIILNGSNNSVFLRLKIC